MKKLSSIKINTQQFLELCEEAEEAVLDIDKSLYFDVLSDNKISIKMRVLIDGDYVFSVFDYTGDAENLPESVTLGFNIDCMISVIKKIKKPVFLMSVQYIGDELDDVEDSSLYKLEIEGKTLETW